MWPDLIRKAKEGGFKAIETYVFWNVHEPLRRQYDFSRNLNLISLIKPFKRKDFILLFGLGLNGIMVDFLYG